MALDDGIVKNGLKLAPPSRWMKVFLLFRASVFFLLGIDVKVLFCLYAKEGACFQCIAVPYRGLDHIVFSMPFSPSMFKSFGNGFISIAENAEIWNGEKNGVLE